MNLHEAHRSLAKRERRFRVGRGVGSGNGKFAGLGMSGANSRSGHSTRRNHEGGQMPLFRRLPKRGFNNAVFTAEYAVVNVGSLKVFDGASAVGPAELFAKGLIRRLNDQVKILGTGDLDRALTVRARKFSKSAAAKIEAAGGKAEVI
jgi:large subunit ribosomal protein L15